MERIPEPELMDDPEQARAYAGADFSEPHDRFVELFIERFGNEHRGNVLDLGCGPGDICRRLARAMPHCRIHGIDGSGAMIDLGREQTAAAALDRRISYSRLRLPLNEAPSRRYDVLLSNSLLHHLADPAVLWQSLVAFGRPGAIVFVMDLLRPGDRAGADALVDAYAAGEPAVLRRDFFNSLLAAYRPEEVSAQLRQQGLQRLQVEVVSDRHLIVTGRL